MCVYALAQVIVTNSSEETARADGWPAPQTRGCDRFCQLNLNFGVTNGRQERRMSIWARADRALRQNELGVAAVQ